MPKQRAADVAAAEHGRTPWDLLNSLIHKPKAWAIALPWFAIVGTVAAERPGYIDVSLKGNTASTDQLADCAQYGVKVTNPTFGAFADTPLIIHGTSRTLPAGYQLWLFKTSSTRLARAAYWPQEYSEVKEDVWSATLSPGESKPGETKHYAIFIGG